MDGNDDLGKKLFEILSDYELATRIAKEAKLYEPEAPTGTAKATVTSGEAISLLDQIISEVRIGWDEWELETSRRQIGTLLGELLKGTLRVHGDVEAMVSARIADIDRLVSDQLNEVFHAPEFQSLEAAWRGLRYLVFHTETGPELIIRILNVSKEELRVDQEQAVDYAESALFKKVYEEYDGIGDAPYGVLVGDYYFGRGPEDVYLLECISKVAAAVHAPFLSAASPVLLGLEDFTELPHLRDLSKKFESLDCSKWKSFRESEESRYIGLTLPHVLMRLPYGTDTAPVEAFNFKEDVDGKDPSKYLWGNAAYVFAARVTNAFHRHGWCAHIRGAETGGLVIDLPQHTFRTDWGDTLLKCPTEVPISDRRRKELAELGFIALCHDKRTDKAIFFLASSCAKAKWFDTDQANIMQRISIRLEYILTVSRFIHYIKCIMRDQVEASTSEEDCKQFLNNWIAQYARAEDPTNEEDEARFPLRSACVEFQEVPEKPGRLRAVVLLQPRFQFYQPITVKRSLAVTVRSRAQELH
jgi:type VI secretion system protein ImpC